MERFGRIDGRAAPLLLKNIDTDTISPMQRLLQGGDALVRYAFEPLRYRADGTPEPDFVLNQPAYQGACILLAGPNFACGSSRETAVWAIAALGFRCVIAPSFGDIFFKNCFQNGILPIVLEMAEVERMAVEARGGASFAVDLQTCSIATPTGRRVPFGVSPLRREALLLGLDEIEMTRRLEPEIASFEEASRRERPWVHLPVRRNEE
jgi:3-isopropylmalate/(R)-2-methylmalate dehydratase small subunit